MTSLSGVRGAAPPVRGGIEVRIGVHIRPGTGQETPAFHGPGDRATAVIGERLSRGGRRARQGLRVPDIRSIDPERYGVEIAC